MQLLWEGTFGCQLDALGKLLPGTESSLILRQRKVASLQGQLQLWCVCGQAFLPRLELCCQGLGWGREQGEASASTPRLGRGRVP